LNTTLLLFIVIAYFLVLLVIAFYSSRGANNESFFIGKKNSSWLLVAYGMIGTSLSGVTFMSVPGGVKAGHFGYLQVVIGYLIGYMVVAFVLLPLYYRLNLTSIYAYLLERFGITAYKTGALFFIVSRTLGATIRIYLVLKTLQFFVLDDLNIPFEVGVAIILLMILLYTFKGGVKTIVLTDTLQTTFMLLALVVTILVIKNSFHYTFGEVSHLLAAKGFTQVFHVDFKAKNFFLKQILGGAFITIAMTGLDQEMMQKNISCRTLKDAQKNMVFFSLILMVVNLLFLVLGGVLFAYAEANHIVLPVKADDLFPFIALKYLSPFVGIVFIIGLISALFPSADGAITALTSSFCIDILNFTKKENWDEKKKEKIRIATHLSMTFLFLICIILWKKYDSGKILDTLLTIAGYTYGPLLGLFSFGILTKRRPYSKLIPLICVVAPLVCFLLDKNSKTLFGGYSFGYELLPLNGGITFFTLWLSSFIINKDSQAPFEHTRSTN